MDTVPRPDDDTPEPRPEAERQASLACEAGAVARGSVPSSTPASMSNAAKLTAWIDSVGEIIAELPPPPTRHR